MGIGKTNAAGGVPLNFAVKAYATEEALLAAAPTKNAIGIITTTDISSWIFSATQPAEAAEGMVWISLGTSSAVEFNALKKNALQVYPIAAYQYVGGVWVSKTAYSYQGGSWKTWLTYIVKDGKRVKGMATTYRSGATALTEQDGNGYFTLTQTTNKHQGLASDEQYVFDDVDSVVLDLDIVKLDGVSVSDIAFKGISVALLTAVGTTDVYGKIAYAANSQALGRQRITLDTSAVTGSYYVGIMIGGTNSTSSANIYNLHLD